ncbi:MAG: hypothetical protein JNM19_07765 [Chitinophagaceae bacterium]|nr:hypothetical protein [Chitinophagaceae bacterium]
MSTWRKKAIELLPDFRQEFEKADTTIYDVFIEVLPATRKAHELNDMNRLKQLYAFAEWCFSQKDKDLWNAAGVSFYEHLADEEITKQAFPEWVPADIYNNIRGLLEIRISDSELKELDKKYLSANRKKSR